MPSCGTGVVVPWASVAAVNGRLRLRGEQRTFVIDGGAGFVETDPLGKQAVGLVKVDINVARPDMRFNHSEGEGSKADAFFTEFSIVLVEFTHLSPATRSSRSLFRSDLPGSRFSMVTPRTRAMTAAS